MFNDPFNDCDRYCVSRMYIRRMVNKKEPCKPQKIIAMRLSTKNNNFNFHNDIVIVDLINMIIIIDDHNSI